MYLTNFDLDWIFDTPKNTKVSRYPLTDIGYTEDDFIVIEIACAGFGINDIQIESEGDNLIIKGSSNHSDKNLRYVQQVISVKDFERIIRIPKSHLDGEITAKMRKGILTIEISKKETPKKVIKITK